MPAEAMSDVAVKLCPSILDNGHRIPSLLSFGPSFLPGRKAASEVYSTCRGKIDPRTGEVIEYVLASRPLFRPSDDGLEPAEIHTVERSEVSAGDTDGKLRAARRAKARLYDLCRYNSFEHFLTLTLDDTKVDGYDYKAAVRRLQQWCDNRVRRHGMAYVIVPELHPSSGRIHFHGLLKGGDLKLVDSGHKDKRGRVIYNCPSWGYGFTTVERLDGSYEAVCHYVAKYMTKAECEMARGTIAGRYYYHGGELIMPSYVYLDPASSDLPFLGRETHVVELPGAGLTLRYFKPGGGDDDDRSI